MSEKETVIRIGGNIRGIVKPIDSLGRIGAIPKDYRESMKWVPGTELEMILLKEGIYIRRKSAVEGK